MIRQIIMRTLSVINKIIPKTDYILFSSFPAATGNSYALYEYILNEHQDIQKKYKLIWSVGESTDDVYNILKEKTGRIEHRVISKSSVKGLLTYMRARYIVSTHGFYPEIQTTKKQTHINLWHGMPFKKIGLAVEEHTGGREDKADITIATSEKFQEIMAAAFGLDRKNVLITGQPCNDVLLKENDALSRLGIRKGEFTHIIMWMPTYRKSIVGDIRQDGDEKSFGVVDVMKQHFNDIDDLLKKNNYLLIIKPHPMDIICKMEFQSSSNILVVKNEDLSKLNIEPYELLGECDVLLTDYSSVFIDYMVTGNPIAFVCDDMESYSGSRGFFFNPPREYMPGELITNYTEFADYLSNMDEINDRWKEKYKEVSTVMNKYFDSNSCKRVYEAIWTR